MKTRFTAFFLCATLLATLLCPLPAAAMGAWASFHYGDEAPTAPAAAVSFLDSWIPAGGTGQVWLRVPEGGALRAAVYDEAGEFVAAPDMGLSPGERHYDFDASAFSPGRYLLVLEEEGGGRLAAGRFRVEWELAPERARVPLLVDEPGGIEREGFPVTVGVPFPRGVLRDAGQVRVVDGRGREVPAQVAPTATWDADGRSTRWLSVFFPADLPAGEGARYYLEYGSEVRPAAGGPAVKVEERDGHLLVDAGRLSFSVNTGRGTILEDLRLDGVPAAARAGLFLQDGQRREYASAWDAEGPEVTLEEAGPLRAVVRQRGWYADEGGERLCRYDVRIEAFAGRPYLRIFHTWILTHDSRAVRFGEISLRIESSSPLEEAAFSVSGPGERPESSFSLPGREAVSLVQSENDDYSIFGWPAGGGEGEVLGRGRRAGGGVSASGGGVTLGAHLREMWQQYPAGLEARESGLAVHFWPPRGFDYRHEPRGPALHRWPLSDGPFMDLQPREHYDEVLALNTERVRGYDRMNALGIAKTHEVWLTLEEGAGVAGAAARARADFEEYPVGRADPGWVGASGALQPFLPLDEENFPIVEEAIRARWESAEQLRELCRNYGWLHYGDHQVRTPSIRPDGTFAFGGSSSGTHRYWRGPSYRAGVEPWLLWIRSGERRYYREAVAMARHFMDIDHIHWPSDEVHPTRRAGQGYLQAMSHYNSVLNTGFVHNEPFGFSLMYYHLAGYRRARDFIEKVYGEVYPYNFREDRVILRAQMSNARHLLDTYRQTWERRYYDNALQVVNRMLDDVIARRVSPSHHNYMYELLYDWRELTGDSRVEPALRSLAEMHMGKPLGENSVYPVLFDLGHLYALTGDPEYIAWGKGILSYQLSSVAVEGDFPVRGRQDTREPIGLTRVIRQVPGFLHFQRLAEEEHGFIQPRYKPLKFENVLPPAYIRARDGREFGVRVYFGFHHRPATWPDGISVEGRARLFCPDGEVVAFGALRSADAPGFLDLRGGGRPGAYRLEIDFEDEIEWGWWRSGINFSWGLGNPDGLDIAYQARRFTFGGGHAFFRVPRGLDSFTLVIPQPGGSFVGEPIIVDARGNKVARAVGAFPAEEPFSWTVNLPPGERGEVFGLVSGARSMTLELGPELAPFVYSDPAEFFPPPEI